MLSAERLITSCAWCCRFSPRRLKARTCSCEGSSRCHLSSVSGEGGRTCQAGKCPGGLRLGAGHRLNQDSISEVQRGMLGHMKLRVFMGLSVFSARVQRIQGLGKKSDDPHRAMRSNNRN